MITSIKSVLKSKKVARRRKSRLRREAREIDDVLEGKGTVRIVDNGSVTTYTPDTMRSFLEARQKLRYVPNSGIRFPDIEREKARRRRCGLPLPKYPTGIRTKIARDSGGVSRAYVGQVLFPKKASHLFNESHQSLCYWQVWENLLNEITQLWMPIKTASGIEIPSPCRVFQIILDDLMDEGKAGPIHNLSRKHSQFILRRAKDLDMDVTVRFPTRTEFTSAISGMRGGRPEQVSGMMNTYIFIRHDLYDIGVDDDYDD